jgi:hypothetical protein
MASNTTDGNGSRKVPAWAADMNRAIDDANRRGRIARNELWKRAFELERDLDLRLEVRVGWSVTKKDVSPPSCRATREDARRGGRDVEAPEANLSRQARLPEGAAGQASTRPVGAPARAMVLGTCRRLACRGRGEGARGCRDGSASDAPAEEAGRAPTDRAAAHEARSAVSVP